ncbi:hypothetical protein PanWU01x14_150180 [Parasponia andersonii]|uniref:Uncharacterized protein n=1 Tax=Parasponia andersonii TaxID=3476 RepID=A0A2P5CIM1_PARAD|nr:hypothetical protein PanWU01x14_150180 [Parasponia andersonii]
MTGSTERSTVPSGNKPSSSETLNPKSPSRGADTGWIASLLSISQIPYSIETLTFEASIGTEPPVTGLGSSATAKRPEMTAPAVWTHRTNGDTKTRWIGKPRLLRNFRPVWNARLRPDSRRGGSQGRATVEIQRGSKCSRRSLMTTTFWCWALVGDWAVGGFGLPMGPLAEERKRVG